MADFLLGLVLLVVPVVPMSSRNVAVLSGTTLNLSCSQGWLLTVMAPVLFVCFRSLYFILLGGRAGSHGITCQYVDLTGLKPM